MEVALESLGHTDIGCMAHKGGAGAIQVGTCCKQMGKVYLLSPLSGHHQSKKASGEEVRGSTPIQWKVQVRGRESALMDATMFPLARDQPLKLKLDSHISNILVEWKTRDGGVGGVPSTVCPVPHCSMLFSSMRALASHWDDCQESFVWYYYCTICDNRQ